MLSPKLGSHSWYNIQGSLPTILLTKKFQDFSRFLQDPQNFISRTLLMLNYRQTAVTYSVYTV